MNGEKRWEGWYPDPQVPDQLRWFNAREWTEHVRPLLALAPDERPDDGELRRWGTAGDERSLFSVRDALDEPADDPPPVESSVASRTPAGGQPKEQTELADG